MMLPNNQTIFNQMKFNALVEIVILRGKDITIGNDVDQMYQNDNRTHETTTTTNS